MNLFTSSFSVAGRLPGAVSISRGKPKWFDGKTFDLLAPEWNWIRNFREGVWRWEQYSEAYNFLLSELDGENICAALGEGAVLLCFCKPDELCHRKLVSAWVESETGLIVREWSTIEQLSFRFVQ